MKINFRNFSPKSLIRRSPSIEDSPQKFIRLDLLEDLSLLLLGGVYNFCMILYDQVRYWSKIWYDHTKICDRSYCTIGWPKWKFDTSHVFPSHMLTFVRNLIFLSEYLGVPEESLKSSNFLTSCFSFDYRIQNDQTAISRISYWAHHESKEDCFIRPKLHQFSHC